MELDRAIQLHANDRRIAECRDSNECPAEPRLENFDRSYQNPAKSPLATHKKQWTGLSLADVLTRLDEVPLRRL
jgi:hypothetical protein